jgi:hypothetical protein
VNEFHVKEMYRDELARMVQARFPHSQWYGQRPTFFSVIAPELPPRPAAKGGESSSRPMNARPSDSTRARRTLYFLVTASRSR